MCLCNNMLFILWFTRTLLINSNYSCIYGILLWQQIVSVFVHNLCVNLNIYTSCPCAAVARSVFYANDMVAVRYTKHHTIICNAEGILFLLLWYLCILRWLRFLLFLYIWRRCGFIGGGIGNNECQQFINANWNLFFLAATRIWI